MLSPCIPLTYLPTKSFVETKLFAIEVYLKYIKHNE